MDLMVLADALLLPQDDLALATVLRSPLFGFSDEQLFALAWERRGSLRAALREQAAGESAFAEANARLDRLAALARRESPFAFYARLLGPEGGRKHYLARLGPEANDALDEFLNLALDYESARDPVAARLRRLAARRPGRGEARHGDHPRRGAGDDGARRQGPGGADRDPGRHHHPAHRAARSAAAGPAARWCSAGDPRYAGLGAAAGGRRAAGARRRAMSPGGRRRTNIGGSCTWR